MLIVRQLYFDRFKKFLASSEFTEMFESTSCSNAKRRKLNNSDHPHILSLIFPLVVDKSCVFYKNLAIGTTNILCTLGTLCSLSKRLRANEGRLLSWMHRRSPNFIAPVPPNPMRSAGLKIWESPCVNRNVSLFKNV